jgi:hypothetical protein
MTIVYTDEDVVRGSLKVASGTEDYIVDLTVSPVTVTVPSGNKAFGTIDLGPGADTLIYSGSGDAVINLGSGNDVFNQKAPGQEHLQITGGAGNDTIFLRGAHADLVYNFSTQVVSGDGHDVITAHVDGGLGFHPGYDVITFAGLAGVVNNSNFTTFFTVTDTPNGDVITDHNNDGWSVQLVGVHLTAQQLIDAGAFHFT